MADASSGALAAVLVELSDCATQALNDPTIANAVIAAFIIFGFSADSAMLVGELSLHTWHTL